MRRQFGKGVDHSQAAQIPSRFTDLRSKERHARRRGADRWAATAVGDSQPP